MSKAERASERGVRASVAVVGSALAVGLLILGLVAARGRTQSPVLQAERHPPTIPADVHSTMVLRLRASYGRALSPRQISPHFSPHSPRYHDDFFAPDGI